MPEAAVEPDNPLSPNFEVAVAAEPFVARKVLFTETALKDIGFLIAEVLLIRLGPSTSREAADLVASLSEAPLMLASADSAALPTLSTCDVLSVASDSPLVSMVAAGSELEASWFTV